MTTLPDRRPEGGPLATLDLPLGHPAPPRLKTRARGPIAAGTAIILIAFGGFGTWAGLAPLNSAAIAPAVVVVESARKTVQHLEGGIIKEILIDEGSTVETGQVLIRLDDTRARTSYDLLQGQLDAALALQYRLMAERDGVKEIAFPPELVSRRNDPAIAQILSAQERLFVARRKAQQGQAAVLRQRMAQFREEITGLRAQQRSKERQIALIREEYKGVKELYDKGIERKPRLLALERAEALLEGERGELIALVSRAEQAIGEAELRIIDLDNSFQQDVATQLRDTEVRVAELRDRLRAQEDVLQRVDIRAPQPGVVVGLKFRSRLGVIPPGAAIMDIVPSEDRLIVEARVRPEDVDVVRVGQTAQIRLTAYKQRNTLTVAGKLVHLSADRFLDERSGLAYYLAKIDPDAQSLAEAGNVQLQAGMPAEVMIETGTRLAIDYMVNPVLISFKRAFRED